MPSRITPAALAAAVALALLTVARAGAAANVQVTPLGSHDGEFCRFDRAMIFEDPDGTRLLYDAGRTVAGAGDPRLGDIDVLLVSHMHGDHAGDRHLPAPNAGECGKPDVSVSAAPTTNTVQIAKAKNAKIVTGSEMPAFFASKLEEVGGDPKASQLVRFGASHKVGGVAITTVPAVHSNGVSPAFIGGQLGELMKAAGISGYAGPPTGYVLTFSNGLAVYLSGDTGITAEQDAVVRRHYGAKLVVMNIGDTFTTGPTEAAFVINELVKPNAVIASHANEVATKDGKVIAGTKTDTFMKASKVPVHLPLSGRTMSFDENGKCVGGCCGCGEPIGVERRCARGALRRLQESEEQPALVVRIRLAHGGDEGREREAGAFLERRGALIERREVARARAAREGERDQISVAADQHHQHVRRECFAQSREDVEVLVVVARPQIHAQHAVGVQAIAEPAAERRAADPGGRSGGLEEIHGDEIRRRERGEVLARVAGDQGAALRGTGHVEELARGVDDGGVALDDREVRPRKGVMQIARERAAAEPEQRDRRRRLDEEQRRHHGARVGQHQTLGRGEIHAALHRSADVAQPARAPVLAHLHRLAALAEAQQHPRLRLVTHPMGSGLRFSLFCHPYGVASLPDTRKPKTRPRVG